VDDDPDVRLFNSTVVEESGYTPVEAANGEEGLKMLKQESPDLVVLDVLMPKQSGIRLYRVLKTEKALKGTPVIILSGVAKRTFLRSQKALTEFGDQPVPEPESYLEKPVEPDELAQEMKKYLG
jgi:twitching motility two-component system response regulator PilH